MIYHRLDSEYEATSQDDLKETQNNHKDVGGKEHNRLTLRQKWILESRMIGSDQTNKYKRHLSIEM
jgi:hypothetical protein